MKFRQCSFAGMFYPKDPHHLEQLLGRLFDGANAPLDAFGIVSPHAGYTYSGRTAAMAYGAIREEFFGTFVVIGPSHRGYLTCTSQTPWETPLGIVEIDREFVNALDIRVDEYSHRNEHSIEVQLPFIKFRYPRARIVPIMMGEQELSAAKMLAESIAKAARTVHREIRVVASSDFSHYIPHEEARRQDLYAIEALKTLDLPEFYRRLAEEGVSACGYGTIAAMCLACQALGAKEAKLLSYTTSGEVTGDFSQVVGYAAIAVI
ncbi:MAG: AmmeMemoRadiSam system protein B [Methanomicrobiales archaeon]|nr:AmmeMemoRadiSam system protein B [Methanomicrobiales archaeon]